VDTIGVISSIVILLGLAFIVWVVIAARAESKRQGWKPSK